MGISLVDLLVDNSFMISLISIEEQSLKDEVSLELTYKYSKLCLTQGLITKY